MRHIARLFFAALLVCCGCAVLIPSAFARQDKESDADTQCLSNLKTIGFALRMYMMDYDEVVPPTKNPAHLQKVISPYLKNKDIFSCPATKTAYKTNPYIGMIPLKEIKTQNTVPVYFDAQPHTDGLYTVLYLDGHANRENQAPVVKPIPRKKHVKAHKHKS